MICAAAVGIALAVAIAVGAHCRSGLTAALSDATRSLGGWIYVAAAALVFLETSALLDFMIHGENWRCCSVGLPPSAATPSCSP